MGTDESKKIDEWKIQGTNAELWIVKDNLQVRYLGTIHNIPLRSIDAIDRKVKKFHTMVISNIESKNEEEK